MKIFIVNLKKSIEKKEKLIKQFEALEIKNYQFIEAVYGHDLSEVEITRNVYDYPVCALIPGEVGCALSHIHIYKEMVEKQIPYALILEDDAFLPDDLPEFLATITASIDVPFSKIITLAEANKISLLRKFSSYKNFGEYTAVTAFCAYAYLINLEAAQLLTRHLLPIKYEADMFIHFRENGWIKQYNVLYPQYIHPMEGFSALSDLKDDRRPYKRQRHEYKRKMLAQRPLSVRIKNRLLRLFWKLKQVKPKK